jgi:RNAse (barnase) inhibitor barstar
MAEFNDIIGDDYYIGQIDGKKCNTLKAFLVEIAIAFRFPDYYGNSVNAFWDCIGDLSWLEAKNYALVILNARDFLKDEDDSTRIDIVNLLQKVANDWANVPNFEGEDQWRQKADFKVIYD